LLLGLKVFLLWNFIKFFGLFSDQNIGKSEMNKTKELLNFYESREFYFFEQKVKTYPLFLVSIILVFISIALLPVIEVNISIQGRGIIRSVTGKTEIKSIIMELVDSIQISEGQSVKKGDTLLVLRQDILRSKMLLYHNDLEKVQEYIRDIHAINSSKSQYPSSALYASQYDSYKQKLAELDNRIKKANLEMNRNKSLFENELIAKKEFEDLTFNLIQLQKERNILLSNQQVQWDSDLVRYMNESEELEKQIEELERQKQFYIITSPISGTVEDFSGYYSGSTVQSGQTLMIISPASEMIAEVYLSPKDIGYIKEGQIARIQVDAFNYNLWGIIEATVVGVSDDFILLNNVPVFKVKCHLSKEYLELKNGVKGNLKKGMTVNTSFMVAKRTLFQLLYQKTDDWLNPSRSLAKGHS
jgi:membrane fusion protein, peptide pheromone/bacteriocin exporter